MIPAAFLNLARPRPDLTHRDQGGVGEPGNEAILVCELWSCPCWVGPGDEAGSTKLITHSLFRYY